MNQNFGVFGYPVSHSLSPAMHTAAFEDLGMENCTYKAYSVLPEDLKKCVIEAQKKGFRGLNLTIPHKEKILEFDFIKADVFAKKAGAVNTLLFDGDEIYGYNTDADGALMALNYAGCETDGKKILIIGAGGASKSISLLFAERGNSVKIINRTADRAEKMAAEIADKTGNSTVFGSGFEDAWKDLENADIVIQTTELGMGKHKNVSLFDSLTNTQQSDENGMTKERRIRKCFAGKTVFDIVYNPEETKFLKEARESGAKTLNGVMMLVFQGAIAFEIWTGKKPDPDVMKAAVLNGLNAGNKRLNG